MPTAAIAMSPDGRRAASGMWDGELRLWDARTDARAISINAHTGPVNAIEFSDEGDLVLSVGRDGLVRVWEAASGRSVATLRGNPGPVYTAAFSADGESVLTAGADGYARVFALDEYPRLAVVPGRALAANAEAQLVVVTKSMRGTRVIDSATGGEVAELSGAGATGIATARFSSDGRWLVTRDRAGQVVAWNAETGRRLAEIPANDPVRSVSADGSVVLTGGGDGSATWALETGEPLGDFPRVAQLSSRGDRVLTRDRGTFQLWSASGDGPLQTFEDPSSQITGARLSPNGDMVLTTGKNGTVTVWDVDGGRSIATIRGDRLDGSSASWSPGGTLLIRGRYGGGTAVWDAVSGAEVGEFTTGAVEGQPSRTLISSNDRYVAVDASGTLEPVRVWDLHSGDAVADFPSRDLASADAAFGRDGRLITLQHHHRDLRKPGAISVADILSGETVGRLPSLAGRLVLLDEEAGTIVTSTTRIKSGPATEIYRCESCASIGQMLEFASQGITREIDEAEADRYLAD